uniref:Putative ovule protein n=1 Tax=Solanum chacoense TaxID=4108 RepID=A0A0V0GU13_SOLCH
MQLLRELDPYNTIVFWEPKLYSQLTNNFKTQCKPCKEQVKFEKIQTTLAQSTYHERISPSNSSKPMFS